MRTVVGGSGSNAVALPSVLLQWAVLLDKAHVCAPSCADMSSNGQLGYLTGT